MGPATPPSYLSAYPDRYARDPRGAAKAWFRDARYGLFLHYGLYSLLGRHEWVQCTEKIPVAEYARLKDRFTAKRFDAAGIARFARQAGFRYVNLTTRHHDSFCLFKTEQTDFNSLNSPCGRDLVGELAEACAQEGLGFFLYYSHGRDWKHPHAPNNDAWGGSARPEYDPPEPSYAYGADHDLQHYLDFMAAQIEELLSQYGPVAGIWLDGYLVPKSGDTARFRCQDLYDRIHAAQPQVLVSYKDGLLGTEDFFTPEHDADKVSGTYIREVCTTMAKDKSWGYTKASRGNHLSAGEVWAKLEQASRQKANLLLNTAPLPDGSLDPEDTEVLLDVGTRIRKQGFPR
ncbi:MAG: alpha-L-fucosidase [Opitutales bacterium]